MCPPDPNDPSTWGLSPEMLAMLNRDVAGLDSPAVHERVQAIEGGQADIEFRGFSPAERRIMGEKIARMVPGAIRRSTPGDEEVPIDNDRAREVLPVLAKILGV